MLVLEEGFVDRFLRRSSGGVASWTRAERWGGAVALAPRARRLSIRLAPAWHRETSYWHPIHGSGRCLTWWWGNRVILCTINQFVSRGMLIAPGRLRTEGLRSPPPDGRVCPLMGSAPFRGQKRLAADTDAREATQISACGLILAISRFPDLVVKFNLLILLMLFYDRSCNYASGTYRNQGLSSLN